MNKASDILTLTASERTKKKVFMVLVVFRIRLWINRERDRNAEKDAGKRWIRYKINVNWAYFNRFSKLFLRCCCCKFAAQNRQDNNTKKSNQSLFFNLSHAFNFITKMTVENFIPTPHSSLFPVLIPLHIAFHFLIKVKRLHHFTGRYLQ